MSIDAITRWVSTVITTVPVVISHQNATKPNGDYINVAFVSSEADCYPHIDKHYVGNDEIRFTASNPTVLSVDITAFSALGDDWLNEIKNRASLPPYRDRPNMLEAGTIRGPAFFNDSGFSPQFSCEFRFRSEHESTILDPRVQRVIVVGFFNGDPITIERVVPEPPVSPEVGNILTDENGNVLIDNDGAILTENVGS